MLRDGTLLSALMLLTACGTPAPGVPDDGPDGMVQQALGDPLMTDPDLAGRNEGNAALTTLTDGTMPPVDARPGAIQTARESALELLGGSSGLKSLPVAREIDKAIPAEATVSASARAALSPLTSPCAGKVTYSAIWAARLPAAFPVYPRGNTQDAAGTDAAGCKLRVVNFRTPVPLDEVLAFYYSRALAAGYRAERIAQDGDDIVSASKGSAAMVVYARALDSNISEIDLVTSGG